VTARISPQSNSPIPHSKPGLTLDIIYRRIAELKPDPANPRRHTKKQIRQIADSIKTFGFNVPILVDHDGKIIAGHGRYEAARLIGMTEVPVLCLDHLPAAQARAFMIADNRLTDRSGWDGRLLAEQLRDLSLLGLDFEIKVTGFEVGEIDLRIASLEKPPRKKEPPALPSLSRVGDVWMLGRHRVLCGDALDPAVLIALMDTALIEKERAAILFTDPVHVDAIVRRWQALTGGSARHAATGRDFDDLAREAGVTHAV
jgi:ParB-like nuclease domain